MSDLTKEQLEEGKKVLEGPKIYFWVLAIIASLAFLFQNSNGWLSRGINFGIVSISFPGPNIIFIFPALYVAALVGLYMRKSWTVPVGRAALVVSMVVLFPVGTIFGAILWKRINDPIAKRYLGYKVDEPEEVSPAAASSDAASATTQTIAENAVNTTEEKPEVKP
jgi:hypothetical protein